MRILQPKLVENCNFSTQSKEIYHQNIFDSIVVQYQAIRNNVLVVK